jgi:hypothetical protein
MITSPSGKQSVTTDDLDGLAALDLDQPRPPKHVYSTVNRLAQGMMLAGTHVTSASTDDVDFDAVTPEVPQSPEVPPTDSFAPLSFEKDCLYGVPSNAPALRQDTIADLTAPELPVKVLQHSATDINPFFSAQVLQPQLTTAVVVQEPEQGYQTLTEADRRTTIAPPTLPERTAAAKALAQDIHRVPPAEESPYADVDAFDNPLSEGDSIYEEPAAVRDESLVQSPQRQLVGRAPSFAKDFAPDYCSL